MSGGSGRPLVAPYLTAEHAEFREFVRSELEKVILPYAAGWEDQGWIARSAWRNLGSCGLLAVGHTGEDFLRSAIFLEELGRTGYAGLRAAVAVHAYMALSYVEMFGTQDQRLKYLTQARRGTRIAALAMTESDAGSDLRLIRTSAKKAGDGLYRVNGEKCYVVNGSAAGFFVTLVATRQAPPGKALSGASMMLIDAESDGVSRFPQPMVGWRSADICKVQFTDVAVSPDRLLGRSGQALAQVMCALDFERLVAGLLAVGSIGYCLDLLRAHVGERQIKDAPLEANQAVRHQIAEFDGDFELLRQYAYHAAWLRSCGRLDSRTASILKLKATELAVVVAQKCVQYHGASGYLSGAAAGRLYCDAIGATIAGGASELLREMIYALGYELFSSAADGAGENESGDGHASGALP